MTVPLFDVCMLPLPPKTLKVPEMLLMSMVPLPVPETSTVPLFSFMLPSPLVMLTVPLLSIMVLLPVPETSTVPWLFVISTVALPIFTVMLWV